MGQKINPIGFRVGISRPWSSRWFFGVRANPKQNDRAQYQTYLMQDEAIRKVINDRVAAAGIAVLDIERTSGSLRVVIKAARPGVVIGRGGKGIQDLTAAIDQALKKTPGYQQVPLSLNVEELKRSEVSAAATAQTIVQDIQRRIRFRQSMRKQLDALMQNKDVKGAKILMKGRLDGAEIARKEWKVKGSLPLQTLRADIDYAAATAMTTYGTIGIKVWIYKGDVFDRD
jgi:small subunit ribosomal protein S3